VLALKIDATVIAYGPPPDRNLALIEVTVAFDRPEESMTVKVLMANGADVEPVRRQLGVAHRVLDVLVPEPRLHRALGELIPATTWRELS
jgi:hypothetical protein